jgi:flavin-dependent dehydrogenase
VQQDVGLGQPVGIVGASAAGLYAGLLLARAGRKIHVFERAERLDPALRTLIVTDRMQRLLGSWSEKSVINKVNRFELFTNGRTAVIPLETPDLIIERADLIRALAQQARNYGAEMTFGRRFEALKGMQGGIELAFSRTAAHAKTSESNRVCCSAVIGADGAQSEVARAAGWPRLKTVSLVQALVRLPAGMPSDTVRVWFIPDDTPYFYWLIPQSARTGALGIIGVEGTRTRRALASFLEKRHFTPLAFQGARIPLYQRWIPVARKINQRCVYLVGDAAAQVKVTTLGGVVTGFRGALGVSETILSGRPSPELRALRRELDLHMLIRRSIHRFRQADYSRLVDWMNERMRRSLSRFSRDDAARVLWHICCNQPRVLLTGIRGLLTSSFGTNADDSSSQEVTLPAASVIQR